MAVTLDIDPPYLVIRPDVTEEEFYRLADEDSDWEYLDGRLVMHSPASLAHEDLFRFLLFLLSGFLDARSLGRVLGSRYPMRLGPRWSPEPDLLVVRNENLHRMTPQRLEGPADLVLEVVSQGTDHLLRAEKLPQYREVRIPEIWVVDPIRKEVRRERFRGEGYETVAVAEGRLESAVLPGFWLDAGWLLGPALPSALDCLRRVLGETG